MIMRAPAPRSLLLVVLVSAVGCGEEFGTAPGVDGDGGSVSPKAGGGGAASDEGSSGGTPARGGTTGAGAAATPESCSEAPASERELCFPRGTFSMGSDAENLGQGYLDHTPIHRVTLSPFFLGVTEVTVGEYRACVEAGACRALATDQARGCNYTSAVGDSELSAVSCVHITDAESYCAWHGGRRLPTEAEWERAARGTEYRKYPWGASFGCSRTAAGTGSCPTLELTQPVTVGSYPTGATPEGLLDMAGNVAEWVADIGQAYSADEVTDPTGPEVGSVRIARGGFWASTSAAVATYVRATSSGTADGPFGIRCARDATD